MEAIGQYYQREEALSQSIKSAVTYPLIMLGMMLAVILVLIIKVLPVFQQVYEELGSSLTGFSKGLLSVGAVLQKYALVFFGGAVFLLALFLFLTKTSKGRDILHKMGSHLPFVRGMYEKISASRFAGAMAITLSSGLDANQSMELAARLSDNKFLEKRIEACQKQMEEGKSFSAALSDTGIFSGLYARMLAIGMKTGTLDDSMKKIAAQYQMEIDDRLARLISSLEPTLVILLSVVVGMILLSVMLPLLGIMTGSGLF